MQLTAAQLTIDLHVWRIFSLVQRPRAFFSCEMVSNSSSFDHKFKILTDMKSHFEDLQIFQNFMDRFT